MKKRYWLLGLSLLFIIISATILYFLNARLKTNIIESLESHIGIIDKDSNIEISQLSLLPLITNKPATIKNTSITGEKYKILIPKISLKLSKTEAISYIPEIQIGDITITFKTSLTLAYSANNNILYKLTIPKESIINKDGEEYLLILNSAEDLLNIKLDQDDLLQEIDYQSNGFKLYANNVANIDNLISSNETSFIKFYKHSSSKENKYNFHFKTENIFTKNYKEKNLSEIKISIRNSLKSFERSLQIEKLDFDFSKYKLTSSSNIKNNSSDIFPFGHFDLSLNNYKDSLNGLFVLLAQNKNSSNELEGLDGAAKKAIESINVIVEQSKFIISFLERINISTNKNNLAINIKRDKGQNLFINNLPYTKALDVFEKITTE